MKSSIQLAAATICLALAAASQADAQYNHTAFGNPQHFTHPGSVGGWAPSHRSGIPSAWGPSMQPQHQRVGGDPLTWGPSQMTGVDPRTRGLRNLPQHGPIGIGIGRRESIGGGIGGSRDGIGGQIGGQISAGFDGGLEIDPRTGRVRGQIQAGVEGSVLGSVQGPTGGVIRGLTKGLSKGISFGI